MRRREVIAGFISAAIVAAPGALSAAAQQTGRVYRIGYLGTNPTRTADQQRMWDAFAEGLREHGLVVGRNVLLERRFSEGQEERLPGFAAELLQWGADVLVVASVSAGRAAKEATSSVPIVMAMVSDPERTGLIASLAHPGGNVTGLSAQINDLTGKYIEMLKEVVPGITRFAVFWNPNNLSSRMSWEDLRDTAPVVGLTPVSIEIRGPGDLDAALAKLAAEKPDAAFIQLAVMAFRAPILAFAIERRIPVITASRTFADPGVLLTYGASTAEGFRRAAGYIDKVLKGAKPADLPVEQPTKFELVINLRTAKALGLAIPPTLLARVDEVIE